MLARPCRFNGGVKGQKIGLTGNGRDHGNHFRNVLRTGIKSLNGSAHLLSSGTDRLHAFNSRSQAFLPFYGGFRRFIGRRRYCTGNRRNFFHLPRHGFHHFSRFGHSSALPSGAFGNGNGRLRHMLRRFRRLTSAGGQLFRRSRQLFRRLQRLSDHLPQPFRHSFEAAVQNANFIFAVCRLQGHVQIAFGHLLGRRRHFRHRIGHGAGDEENHGQQKHQRKHAYAKHRHR